MDRFNRMVVTYPIERRSFAPAHIQAGGIRVPWWRPNRSIVDCGEPILWLNLSIASSILLFYRGSRCPFARCVQWLMLWVNSTRWLASQLKEGSLLSFSASYNLPSTLIDSFCLQKG
ncbi:hypothetical protein VPH35_087173 [Triticum aestivum]